MTRVTDYPLIAAQAEGLLSGHRGRVVCDEMAAVPGTVRIFPTSRTRGNVASRGSEVARYRGLQCVGPTPERCCRP